MADTTNATVIVSDDEFDHWPPSETSEVPVIVTNAVSVAACLAVLVSYFIFRRKHKRIMERNSLVLAVSMAAADLLLHSINLFGYSDLPDGFICEFFGGFLYAFPTLISLFYSFNIALNTQLVFVFGKRPGQSKLKYYISIPILLSLCICIPALATHLYGFDVSFDMCWYKTEHRNSRQVLLPYFFTFAFWCLMVVAYLIVAGITIIFAVFSKTSRLNHLATNLSKSLSSNSHAGSAPHMMVAGMTATTNLPMQPQATLSSGKGQQMSSFGMTDSDEIGGVGDGRGRKLMYSPHQQERYQKQKRQWLASNQQRREFDRDPMILTHKSDFEMDTTGISALSRQGAGDHYQHQYGRSPAVSSKQTATMMSMHGRSVSVVPPNQTLSRRSLAMRALALRLLGYITIPMICILPGVIDDLLIKAIPSRGPDIPGALSTCFDSLNGLIGLMNALLYALDPALLALYHQIRVEREERKKRSEMAFTSPTASRMDTQTYEPHGRNYHHHGRMASHGGGISPGPYSADLELSNVQSKDDNGSFKYNKYNENDNEDVQVRTEGRMNTRKTRFLSPLLKKTNERTRNGTVQSSLPSGHVRQTTSAFGGGIVIRVDVQVDRDDIDRLENYLVGL